MDNIINKKDERINLLLLAAIVVIGVLFLFLRRPDDTSGAAFQGSGAVMATSSTVSIATSTNVTLFATSTPSCTSRVVSTQGKPILITFDSKSAPDFANQYGHVQGASTTIAYDSDLYGCGIMRAVSYDSTTTITVSEFR